MPEHFTAQYDALRELVADNIADTPEQLGDLMTYAINSPACMFVFGCALITAVAVIFKHIFKTLSKLGGV